MEMLASSTMPPASPDELLDLLERSGGSVGVVDPPEPIRAAWRRLLHVIRSERHVPSGWHLVQRGRDAGDLVLELRRGAHPSKRYRPSRRTSIPIPADLRNAHPAIELLRNQPERLPESEANRSRTLLLLQALASTAEARGYLIRSSTGTGLLTVVIDDSTFELRLYEETGARWSCRLVLELVGPGDGRSRWADHARRRVEDELAAILRELARRAKHKRAVKDAASCAVEQERQHAVVQHMLAIAREQVTAWQLAGEIRAHCAELVDAGMPDDDPWLTWARDYADTIDPLTDPPGLPADGNPTAEADPPGFGRERAVVSRQPIEQLWHPNQRWYHH